MTGSKPSAPKVGVGRPRAAGSAAGGAVREEILDAARTLFRDKGYAGTSTREIARLAGLRQPSLFHYFPGKESILREVALRAVQPVLDFVAAEPRRRLPPDVALYRLVRFDTWHLCTNENALGSPFQLSDMGRERLPEFWRLRDELTRHYRRLVRQGARASLLEVDDVGIVTRALFALGEATLELDQQTRRRRADRLATVTADLALRAVLKDPTRLDEVRAAAGAVGSGAAVE